MKEIKLSALIPPTFRPLYGEIKRDSHLEYWLKGGRGSGKSSFVSLVIILGMMRITYLPTGQRVVFRGLDNAKKVKSAKLARGYFKYVWFEELSEFSCHEEMRGAMQTFVRGGEKFAVFASYNPPRSVKSWVNAECALPKSSRYVHHSTYLDVLAHPDGAAWLGEAFVLEARHQERQNPALYAHEYLGEASGTGGEVFANVTLREIAGKEAAAFDRLHFGIDWGYAVDPFCFVAMHYDAARRTVFIFDEIFCSGLSNRSAATSILARHPSAKITADCAEPKSIDELNSLGLHVRGAKKGAGSVAFGIKWLASLSAIVIDPVRCPHSAREFSSYEYPSDGLGGFRAQFLDKDNHSIDAVRYALEGEMRARSTRFVNFR